MSKYKLSFKLKQHTPIIHFQHDQEGATLRASELKPKLDKFLIEKLKLTKIRTIDGKEKEVPKNKYKDWFINKGKEHLALDYKVRVEAERSNFYLPLPNQLNSKKYPQKEKNAKIFLKDYLDFEFEYLLPTPFFANADKIKFLSSNEIVDPDKSKPEEIIYAVIQSKISSLIKCFHTDLLEKINNILNEFFLVHNFGTRQNKGFGSYTISEINGKKITIEKELLKKYFIKVSTNTKNDFNLIFKFILEEYTLLKSGINIPFGSNPRYDKSELFKYFIDKNIRWEKRFIKRKLNNNSISLKKRNEPIDYDESKMPKAVTNDDYYYNDYTDRQGNEYKYIRALLGLAENFEFQLDSGKRFKVKIISTDSDKVERFQSPIFFKVIDGSIYLGVNESYKNIEEKKFKFEYDGTSNRTQLGTLDVPNNFDLKDFITNYISTNWKNV